MRNMRVIMVSAIASQGTKRLMTVNILSWHKYLLAVFLSLCSPEAEHLSWAVATFMYELSSSSYRHQSPPPPVELPCKSWLVVKFFFCVGGGACEYFCELGWRSLSRWEFYLKIIRGNDNILWRFLCRMEWNREREGERTGVQCMDVPVKWQSLLWPILRI